MNDLARIRGRFVTAAVVLSLLSVGLLVYLFWPRGNAPGVATLREQYRTLQSEVSLWEKSNPDALRADLKSFYADDVPAKWSQISQHMDKLVQETGVSAPGIHYDIDTQQDKTAPTLPGVEQIKIQTTVTGDYSKVARFINRLEQDKTFFIIDKISLSSHEGGTVSLNITIDTFLRQVA